ncbi:biotin/lipoyl-binding protein [Chitinophaga sp.]|uniref:biotin/lipoyl-binding protein n=1 Tax=Chitinophaga sp. TaxID=1869181 RepID=UPI0031D230DC
MTKKKINVLPLFVTAILFLQACKNSEKDTTQQPETVQAEILALQPTAAVIDQSFPAGLQGKDNVQLRPQISGYLDKIYVDEGSFVQAGQALFRINASVYREQKNITLSQVNIKEINNWMVPS